MSKKFIAYWFSSLPFVTALKILMAYLFTKLFPRNTINFHFSQTGEDIILCNLLSMDGGFYIDVGCNEPIKGSNTFIFYLKGWKGITIDANSSLIRKYKKIRKLDTAICAAVSNKAEEVIFYKSDVHAVSTINQKYVHINKDRWRYTEAPIHTRTLTSILDEHLPQGSAIDLLTIDVEGIDLEVLQGLSFENYRPGVIVVEDHNFAVETIESNPIYQLLTSHNYKLHGFATMNVYFVDRQQSGKTIG